MPFTLAHPAAVLPFARTKLVFSALIAGALAPDVGYFLSFTSGHAESHSLAGLLWFCLPSGLLILLLFQKLLKRPLLALFPASHQARLYPYAQGFRFAPVSRFGLILLSLLIGSSTHLLWDSFTHNTGWAVRAFPELTMPLLAIRDERIPTYKLLQHGSSVLGLVVLGLAYYVWLRRAEPSQVKQPKLSSAARIAIATAMLAGACAAALWRTVPPLIAWETIRANVVNGGIAFVTAFVIEAVLFSLIWRFCESAPEI